MYTYASKSIQQKSLEGYTKNQQQWLPQENRNEVEEDKGMGESLILHCMPFCFFKLFFIMCKYQLFKCTFYIELFRIMLAWIKYSINVIYAYYFTSLLLHFRACFPLHHCDTKVNNNQPPHMPYALLYSCATYIHVLTSSQKFPFPSLPVEILLILPGPIQILPPPELYTGCVILRNRCNCLRLSFHIC